MHQYFTPFQNVCHFGIVLSQTSPTLTKFVEKYILTSTIPNKCTNKIYFMVNLIKLTWHRRHWDLTRRCDAKNARHRGHDESETSSQIKVGVASPARRGAEDPCSLGCALHDDQRPFYGKGWRIMRHWQQVLDQLVSTPRRPWQDRSGWAAAAAAAASSEQIERKPGAGMWWQQGFVCLCSPSE